MMYDVVRLLIEVHHIIDDIKLFFYIKSSEGCLEYQNEINSFITWAQGLELNPGFSLQSYSHTLSMVYRHFLSGRQY